VQLESGGVLKAGTVCKVVAETEDAFGIEWVEDGLHLMAIARHKAEVVSALRVRRLALFREIAALCREQGITISEALSEFRKVVS
jgi:hypothetical protein